MPAMSEIVIFRHAVHEGPGYLADYLDRRRLPWRLVRVDRQDPIPTSLAGIAGLVFMGGPMSVNDRLPWIPPVLRLIRQAVDRNVPVLGHCLGGQLMAKALGGRVTRNRIKEIGWLPVEAIDNTEARKWINGLAPRFEVFHWHGETFSELPPGAVPILKSRDCRHQAFVLGPHLAFQCHIEMTPGLVRSWAKTGSAEIANPSATVQGERRMRVNLVARAVRLNRIADVFYDRWVEGLHR
jgi:GMP synthase-like glutamine amidotransferase